MLIDMTAPFLPHAPPIVNGSQAAAGVGIALAASVAHAIDAAQMVGGEPRDWTDTLLSEMRRHLALGVAGAEAALLDALSEILPETRKPHLGFSWNQIQATPAILGSDLLAYMRVRATVGLLSRWTGNAIDEKATVANPDLRWLQSDDDPEIAASAARLATAEDRWGSMRLDPASALDLPHGLLCDLVWTVASIIGQSLGSSRRHTMADILPAIIKASEDVIAANVGQCPVQGAAALAALIADRPDAGVYLGQALGQRRLLPFAALAGEYLSLPADLLLHLFLHSPAKDVAGVCHALGGSPSDYQHLLMQLRVARASLTDAAVLSLVADYSVITNAEAGAVVSRLRCPAGLTAKIDLAQRLGAV